MDTKHVVVLGAGFSRAVSPAMPLTDELGRQAVESIVADGGRLGFTPSAFGPELTFESWLSLLSEDQPQLSEAQNRDNAATFAHLRDAIAERLLMAQRQALGQPAPGWLYDLVSVLHRRRPTVLTLNYDALVETGVDSHDIWDREYRRRVGPADVLRNLPSLPNMGARVGGPLCETFRLLKLHGSLDWWAVPNDISGATLNREETHGVFGDPYEMSVQQRQRELPGRERFIVPPLSAKNSYYRNPLIREVWQQAHRSLVDADRISLVGYSLPPNDLVVTSMLRDALSDRDVRIDVVNPDADALLERLVSLGAVRDALHLTADAHCVESFTKALCAQASAVLADDLRRSLLLDEPDAALAVAWGSPDAIGRSVRRVTEISVRTDGAVEVILDESNPATGATSARFTHGGAPSPQHFASAADMMAVIGRSERVIARGVEGEHLLIAAWHEGRNVGANARWIIFAPADRAPA